METRTFQRNRFSRGTTSKICVIAVFALSFLFLFTVMTKLADYNIKTNRIMLTQHMLDGESFGKFREKKTNIAEQFFIRRKNKSLSALGEILYKFQPVPKTNNNKSYKILIWKDGSFLERRHIRYFQEQKHDPFEECSVNNCHLTYNSKDLQTSDAVVVLLHRLKGPSELPKLQPRPKNQRWIFLTDESPQHTFLFSENIWRDYSNVFNWSMSYRIESDVPTPYGRTVPLKESIRASIPTLNLIPNGKDKRRDKLVAIMLSNCDDSSHRQSFLKSLEKYIEIDVYGQCGTELKNVCPGHFGADCPKLNDYMFYLSFENSKCEEYMTEKLFWNAYHKGAVPIIMGASKRDCETFLPPNSYIHVDDYAKPIDLAWHLLSLNKSWDYKVNDFHEWRRYFNIVNEHGYFGSKSLHYCRICEALKYNDQTPKIYKDLSYFLDPNQNCKNP